MRIPASLLLLGLVLAGCKSSISTANLDSILITSNPPSAAVRLNGAAVGRTPATIQLDRTKNYELQVGKGGFLTETSDLKPRLITTSAGVEFGFPASVMVNLTKIPDAGEAGVPVADNPEFKTLTRKALGEEAVARESLLADVATTQEAISKIRAALAAQEAASQTRIAEINKAIAGAKSAAGSDETSKARLAEAQLALVQATAAAAETRRLAEQNLQSATARAEAMKGADAKVSAAREKVAQVSANPAADGSLAQLEGSFAKEIQALNASQGKTRAALNDLNARADELSRLAQANAGSAQQEAAASLVDIQKSLVQQKAIAAQANEAVAQAKADTDEMSRRVAASADQANRAQVELLALQAKVTAAEQATTAEMTAAAAKLAETQKAAAAEMTVAATKLAETQKAAEKALADARLDAEAKLAETQKATATEMAAAAAKLEEANKLAAEAKARADALKYSEFSSRYALLESKRRSKAITEEEFKSALATLRKELAL